MTGALAHGVFIYNFYLCANYWGALVPALLFTTSAKILYMEFFDAKLASEKLDALIAHAPQNAKDTILIIAQVGENVASQKYVLLKQKYCQNMGVRCEVFQFDTQNYIDFERFLVNKSRDPNVGSIIVQLPLPDTRYYPLLDLIPLEKDIDLLSKSAKFQFYSDDFTFLSPVLRATEYFLCSLSTKYDTIKRVGIIGFGDLVGKPLTKYLSTKFEKVEVIKNYVASQKLDFDLLVLSTDVPNLVKGEGIKPNCNVIDFGSSVVDGKTVGNLDLNSKLDHLGIVSKSPGGMGPLVVRYLVMNHLKI